MMDFNNKNRLSIRLAESHLVVAAPVTGAICPGDRGDLPRSPGREDHYIVLEVEDPSLCDTSRRDDVPLIIKL